MATAGFYETSGDWLYDVGLPGKSGIGGGIVTVSPGKGGFRRLRPAARRRRQQRQGTACRPLPFAAPRPQPVCLDGGNMKSAGVMRGERSGLTKIASDSKHSISPSTVLRTVPLPRFAGEDKPAATVEAFDPPLPRSGGGGGPCEAWWRGRASQRRRTAPDDDGDRGARAADVHDRHCRVLRRRRTQSSHPAAQALEHSGGGDRRPARGRA